MPRDRAVSTRESLRYLQRFGITLHVYRELADGYSWLAWDSKRLTVRWRVPFSYRAEEAE